MATNYEMRPNKGSLFRNRDKTKEDQPSYKGKLMLANGEKMRISAWVNKTSAGEPYFSFNLEPLQPYQKPDGDTVKPFGEPALPVAVPVAAPAAVPVRPAIADMDDDLPF